MLCPLQMAVLLLLFKINVIFCFCKCPFLLLLQHPSLPAQELCSRYTQWRDYMWQGLAEIKIQGFFLAEANTELPVATSW